MTAKSFSAVWKKIRLKKPVAREERSLLHANRRRTRGWKTCDEAEWNRTSVKYSPRNEEITESEKYASAEVLTRTCVWRTRFTRGDVRHGQCGKKKTMCRRLNAVVLCLQNVANNEIDLKDQQTRVSWTQLNSKTTVMNNIDGICYVIKKTRWQMNGAK